MKLSEMMVLFIDSRKRGTSGARKKAAPATISIYEINLAFFVNFVTAELGILDYKDLKRTDLIKFLDMVDARQTSGKWSKATVLQHMRCLRTFFRWVDRDEDCTSAGLRGLQKYLPAIEKTPRRTDMPGTVDLKNFKNGFNTKNRWGYRDYVAICLMLDTGIRAGEVCNLRIDHALLDQNLMLVTGKTGPRPIPVTDTMVNLLRGWLKKREKCPTAKDSPYIFVTKYDPQMTPNGMGQRFRKHRSKFKLPRITAHTFRHTFCTNYLSKGGDMERLRLVTGHQTYDMLRDYLHLSKVGSKVAKDELEKVSILKDL